MGALDLPKQGLVYLDANSIIYTVEVIEPYLTALPSLWEAARIGIHATTALMAGCELFITNDVAFKKVPGLPVAVLSEITASA